MRKSLASMVMVAGLQLARPVHAEEVKPYPECTHEPTDTDLTAAKGAFQAGNASFDEADYPRAIVYWEDAYRRDCTAHALLLNLARAYELNGNKPQAVLSLQTYLQRVPGSPDKEKIERRIEVLNKQIEAEKAQTQAAAAGPQPPAPQAAPLPPPAPAPAPVQPVAPAQGKAPIAPLIFAGVGGIAAIGGVVLYATGKSDVADAEKSCGDKRTGCPADVTTRGNNARTRTNIGGGLLVGGVVVAGAGLAWYFLAPRTSSSTGSERGFTPLAGPNFVGMSYAGLF